MGAIVVYPPTPLAEPASGHTVRVLGVPVGGERYAGVSVARFAMRGPVTVEVEVAGPINSHAIFPAERAAAVRVDGSILRFTLEAPQSVVVWIDGLEKLFVLPDPLEDPGLDARSPAVVVVVDRGADPTGARLATTPLQTAIDEAAGRPGGATVFIPPGVFRTGTLRLKSNVTLHLAPGALLQGSSDPEDYPLDPGRRESASAVGLPPDVRYLGRTMTFSRLLLIDRADNVRITGRGTIDGDGTFLRTHHRAAPNLLRIRQSSRVTIEDVLFRNAAAWSLHVLASSDVTIRNVKVINDRANLNTDGIDVDMSTDVAIDEAFIHTKDDAICVKATGNGGLTGDPTRIRVTNSVVSALDAGLKIGSEASSGSITDVVFERDFVFDAGRAMSIVVRDGATVERVAFRAIGIGANVDHLVEQVLGVRDPDSALGAIRDLVFEDIAAPAYTPPASNWTWYAQFRPGRPGLDAVVNVFEGADEAHAVDRLRLTNVVVNGRPLDDARTAASVANLTVGPHVRNVTFG
jgi:polygalacturonase